MIDQQAEIMILGEKRRRTEGNENAEILLIRL